jgi:glycosyltransferase involved in cell wall biosynthesis
MMYQKPIRVAQVLGESQNGGVEAVIRNYYRFIDRSKYQFDFYVTNTSAIIQKEEIEGMGGRIYLIPHYKTNLFSFEHVLYKDFVENKYLIVHSNMNTLSYFVLHQAKKAEVPIRIAHSHSTSNPEEHLRNMIKNILRKRSTAYATDYLACSEVAGKWLFGEKIFDTGKVKILNNGVDLEKFRFREDFRKEIRTKFAIPDDTVVLGHIGRLVSQKNQSFLLDVFAQYQKLNPNSVLMILGEGPLKEELEKKAKELALENKILFVGIDEHPEKYYSAFDVFLLPSLYEGLPVVLVEAQASGLPCYVSENVSLEAKVLPSTLYLPIHSSEDWAKVIREGNIKTKEERWDAYSSLKGGKFDLKQQASDLTGYYDNLVAHYYGETQK